MRNRSGTTSTKQIATASEAVAWPLGHDAASTNASGGAAHGRVVASSDLSSCAVSAVPPRIVERRRRLAQPPERESERGERRAEQGERARIDELDRAGGRVAERAVLQRGEPAERDGVRVRAGRRAGGQEVDERGGGRTGRRHEQEDRRPGEHLPDQRCRRPGVHASRNRTSSTGGGAVISCQPRAASR